MDAIFLTWIKSLIVKHELRSFYRTRRWRRTRKEVLDADRNECQWCKAKGMQSTAAIVHHINYLDKHPEWALDVTVIKNGKEERNLISLCRECHENHHQHSKRKSKPLTAERW